MAKILWIASVLRDAGCKVYEMPGWQNSQTRPDFDPQGLVCHHTATGPNWTNQKVRELLRNGRQDLKGPLSQLGLRRDGVFDIIAAGRCNHNGYGEWGNDAIAIEAYNDGKGEPWGEIQMEAYAKGSAAIGMYLGWQPSKVKGHKETDPGRKIDPTFDMDEFRVSVKRYMLSDKPKPEPPKPSPVVEPEDSMFTLFFVEDQRAYYSMTPWAVAKLTAEEGYLIDASSPISAVVIKTTATWDKIKKNAPSY
jgi:hypothetical protein